MSTSQLATLIGSRICHDLISPLGAISNGLELLAMSSGQSNSPEMALIADSVANANARIRFFRVAFGMASAEQHIGKAEIDGILRDLGSSARATYDWRVAGDVGRVDLRAAFLAMICVENALPFGGTLSVAQEGDTWVVRGESEKLRLDEENFARLTEERDDMPIPSKVHFALFPMVIKEMGRDIHVSSEGDFVEIRF